MFKRQEECKLRLRQIVWMCEGQRDNKLQWSTLETE